MKLLFIVLFSFRLGTAPADQPVPPLVLSYLVPAAACEDLRMYRADGPEPWVAGRFGVPGWRHVGAIWCEDPPPSLADHALGEVAPAELLGAE